jgi:arginine decarboxylase
VSLAGLFLSIANLKKICPTLDSIDIGGGFPIKTSLTFQYDYKYMIEQIVENIKWICEKNNVPKYPTSLLSLEVLPLAKAEPCLYSMVDQKLQNDKELVVHD